MILAGFSSIHKSYPSVAVLEGASGAVKTGEKIALLGANGTGKTTLLEILAGKLKRDTGILEIPNSVKRGYLPQEVHVSDTGNLLEYAAGGLEDLVKMKHRLREIHSALSKDHGNKSLLGELGRLQSRFEELGGYQIESRAREILTGLGFDSEEHEMKLTELSGGMRNRAALVRLLISSPDLMLLDEPTNHLDISGLDFLELFLKSFDGGVIYVSHDRAFIRNTATTIWEMVAGKIMVYAGGYDNYLVEREERLSSAMKNYEAQKEFISKTEDFIRRNIAGQKTKQAKSRRKMLAKMERLRKPPSEDAAASLRFADVGRSARIVVKCNKAFFSYDSNPFLQDLNFIIERGDQIGLFGPNGSGKTTIIKLILGELEPVSGRIELGKRLTVGYYDQLTENLDKKSDPLSTIRTIMPEWSEPQIRSYLARFLFKGEDVLRRIDSFSGGEQSRLVLARLLATEPNFLVLDEPTNHLDIQSREALEAALTDYRGTILCVSHDREFLNRLVEKIFAIENGSLGIFLGDYSDYRQKILARTEDMSSAPRLPKSSAPSRKRRKRRVNPQIVSKAKAEISKIEGKISDLETVIKSLESSSDWERLSALLEQRDNLYSRLEILYARLERLQENEN
jgi:ATP-binding cassette subfamily F protein 3